MQIPTNGKFICKCKEVEDIVFNVVILEVVHHVCAVTFDLLIRGDSTEHNLGEALRGKHPETDPSNGTVVLDEGQSAMLPDWTREGGKVPFAFFHYNSILCKFINNFFLFTLN